METYITHPGRAIEYLAAEDFRIVFSDENTVVLSYIESVKFANKEAENFAVIETYSKVKGNWKLAYKQFGNQ
jgi:hypothetical protein